MKVFILLSVFALALANECGENQHRDACGTMCPLTCKNYMDPPKACVLMCNPGCHCNEGYVKTEDGKCVKPENCPAEAPVCGENQRYNGCGTACPLTCDNHKNPPKMCPAVCKIGCECEEGYVKTADGRCVRPEECPAKASEVCGENERFNGCGTACPLTCDNYENPPKICVMMCKIGCECEEGFVRSPEGKCVKPSQCPAKAPKVCGENERFNECGTACPLTCRNFANPPKFCVKMCKMGCECEEGFVRSEDGKCVKPSQCPAKAREVCGENERFNECGTACPLTCDNYANPPKFCVKMCKIGCECEEGFVRSSEGKCVKPSQCPAKASEVCGENERFNECGTACPLTCENYENPPKFCVLMCKPGCECEEGFVRSQEGKCVRSSQCPQASQLKVEAEDTCNMPAETGMCRGMFRRFYFNKATGQCEEFVYGGCGGNSNNFKTEEDCKTVCGSKSKVEPDNDCELPSESGVCRGFFPRYYFDKSTGECHQFIYGGCGGNNNNFESVEECQKSCGLKASTSVCQLPPEQGRCIGYFKRFFHNSETGKCEEFIYGGCGGNENNFRIWEECVVTCGSS